MADLTIINCNAQGQIFTGLTECGNYNTGDYVGSYVSKKGTTIPNDDTFLVKLKEAIQKNNLIPLDGYDYRNNHEENQINTSSIGNMQLQRLGKPMFEIDITSSICEAKAISKINNSSNNWDLWHVFENAIICATAPNGNFVGFDLNVLHAESTKLKQGADLQMKTLKAQLRSSTQYNEGMTLIPITDALAEVKELKGIIEAKVSIVINSLNTLSVTVTDTCSGNPIEGLTATANWTILGTQTTPSTIDSITANSNGNYTIALNDNLISTDTIGLKLAESGFESVEVDGSFYGGSSSLLTLSALLPFMTSISEISIESGAAGSFQVVATNTPTLFEITVGSLPSGVTINGATGLIEWDDTVTNGDTNVTLKITNANGFTLNPITISAS